MNTTPDNQLEQDRLEHNRIESRLRETFRRSCADVDQIHLHRLARARRQALTPEPRPRPSRMLIPAGAVAASLLAFVLVWEQPGGDVAPGPAQVTQQTTAPAPEQADMEFFSDLEFYRWLAAQSPATAQR